jgi:hypothetical protein
MKLFHKNDITEKGFWIFLAGLTFALVVSLALSFYHNSPLFMIYGAMGPLIVAFHSYKSTESHYKILDFSLLMAGLTPVYIALSFIPDPNVITLFGLGAPIALFQYFPGYKIPKKYFMNSANPKLTAYLNNWVNAHMGKENLHISFPISQRLTFLFNTPKNGEEDMKKLFKDIKHMNRWRTWPENWTKIAPYSKDPEVFTVKPDKSAHAIYNALKQFPDSMKIAPVSP